MWQYQNTDELYHHGVPGQRWGFRRYQNPDGTLTPAGRRRANKLAEKYAKVTGKKLIVKKKSVQGNEKERPKTISEMSDYELQNKINRMRLEDTYMSIVASRAPKPQVSRGKRFINNLKRNVISPAFTDAGKAVLTNFLKKKGNELVYGNKNNNSKNNNSKNNNSKNSSKANDKINDIENKAKEYIAKNKLNYAKKEYEYFQETGEKYIWGDNKNKKNK